MFGSVVHKFQRNQNHQTSKDSRLQNRSNPFDNTLRVLEDPAQQRTLFLIGSTHSSTLLAQRTKELVQNEKPDSLFVQTNEKWWGMAKHIQDVNNQEEFNQYRRTLNKAFEFEVEGGLRNFRNTVFWARFYVWLFQMNQFNISSNDFSLFTPGLEVKYAIEQAEALKSRIIYGGLAIDNGDLQSLKVTTHMNPIQTFWNYFKTFQQIRWSRETDDMKTILGVVGGEGFAESIDKYRANWFVKYFEKVSPQQKRILVDKKDEQIFKTLYRDCPGKKIVAVVNQWHMDGIETHWRHTTKTQELLEPINPIGDMDLTSYYEDNLVNDFLRTFTSRITKSEPASSRNYLTQYFKDCQEAERFRHVEFFSHDDPHMYHGSPYEDGYEHHHDKLPLKEQAKLAKLLEDKKHQDKHHH